MPPEILIVVRRGEDPAKCTVRPLRGTPGLEFRPYPLRAKPDLSRHLLLAPDAPPLTLADAGRPLLLLDASWRHAGTMRRAVEPVEARSIPPGWQTAYPRRSKFFRNQLIQFLLLCRDNQIDPLQVKGSYAGAFGLNVGFSVVAGFGVVLAAVYLLIMFQRAFYGPNDNPVNQRLKDLKPWEIAVVGVFILFVFWGGLYPSTFTKPMEASIGATRLMVLAPEGSRPNWDDETQEIDGKGNLVRVTESMHQGDVTGVEIIQSAELHFKSSQGAIAQR